MDGTLIDSKKDITISINHIRDNHYNLPPLTEEFVVEAINMEVRNLPKLFYGTEIYHEKDRALFETHYAIQCTKNPYLYHGIHDMLLKLKSLDIKISLATNAPTKFAEIMLKHLNVDMHFDIIIGADKVEYSKPSPEMLEHILDYYKYDNTKDEAWMIGDNSKDMLSAQNANINSIFATWGFSPKSEHEIIVSHPKEVLDIVL